MYSFLTLLFTRQLMMLLNRFGVLGKQKFYLALMLVASVLVGIVAANGVTKHIGSSFGVLAEPVRFLVGSIGYSEVYQSIAHAPCYDIEKRLDPGEKVLPLHFIPDATHWFER